MKIITALFRLVKHIKGMLVFMKEFCFQSPWPLCKIILLTDTLSTIIYKGCRIVKRYKKVHTQRDKINMIEFLQLTH